MARTTKSSSNKASKEHKGKKSKNHSADSSTDGLMKLAVVVAIFSVLLFAAFSMAVGSQKKEQSSPVPSRVIPKYANPDGTPLEAEAGCEDRNSMCPSYAARGECDKAVGWMVGKSNTDSDALNNSDAVLSYCNALYHLQ